MARLSKAEKAAREAEAKLQDLEREADELAEEIAATQGELKGAGDADDKGSASAFEQKLDDLHQQQGRLESEVEAAREKAEASRAKADGTSRGSGRQRPAGLPKASQEVHYRCRMQGGVVRELPATVKRVRDKERGVLDLTVMIDGEPRDHGAIPPEESPGQAPAWWR